MPLLAHSPIVVTHALRWLPLVPFAGAVINAFAGPALQARLGRRAVHAVAVSSMIVAAVFIGTTWWSSATTIRIWPSGSACA